MDTNPFELYRLKYCEKCEQGKHCHPTAPTPEQMLRCAELRDLLNRLGVHERTVALVQKMREDAEAELERIRSECTS